MAKKDRKVTSHRMRHRKSRREVRKNRSRCDEMTGHPNPKLQLASFIAEACVQIAVASIGMLGVFGFIGFAFFLVFQGMEPGFNAEFVTFCLIIGSILTCVGRYHQRGWNIFEIFGGRRGGAVG
jgi:hypothetical protein